MKALPPIDCDHIRGPMRKKIHVNGRFLCRPLTGVDRYALEVLNAIDAMLADGLAPATQYEWEVICGENIVTKPEWRHINIVVSQRPATTLWEQTTLCKMAWGAPLISLCNSAPVLHPNQLVVIHDAATKRAPYSYSKGFRAWYALMIPLLLRRATLVGTVSAFSRQELLDIYGVLRPIRVLKEGAEHLARLRSDDTILDKHQLRNRPYVLGVSSMAPHKNFKALIAAIQQLEDPPFDVVLAGGANPKIFASADAPLPAWVKALGYVSDQELKSLYKHAACFVFPSLYEGYGLPPTEAMALGCPVLSSDSASLPEVCGNAALYFKGDNPADLAQKLRFFFANSNLAAQLRSRGFENTRDKTWRHAATSLIESLEFNAIPS